jgi:hypothetical protein
MSFAIEYEDLKKLLNVFYNSPYRNVVGYIELLHNLKETESDITLKEKIDLEIALAAKTATQGE